MKLSIETRLAYTFAGPTDALLQIEVAHLPEQPVLNATTGLPPVDHFARISGHDAIGERIWLRFQGELRVDYRAEVSIERIVRPLGGLGQVEPHRLPGETVEYLMGSRYCPATRFHHFVEAEFGNLMGGDAVLAMRDWITGHFTYEPMSSTSETTALETFVERRGVCRDFAHTLITFARAKGIPARFASVYAPDVTPQDFHAVAEVFLEVADGVGEWHLVDATGMAKESEIAKIGVGRDAADVSFLTCYGEVQLTDKQIAVTRLGD